MKNIALVQFIVIFLFSTSLFKPLFAQEPEHPSLFFTVSDVPAIKQNIADSEWMKQAYEVIIEQANEMMEFGSEPFAYSESLNPDYGHTVGGDWKKIGILGRILEKRVGTLGIAGYLSGDQRYLNKAIEIIIASAEASDPEEWYGHLQQADGARGYAIGYDLLYPYMDDRERLIVRNEIDRVATILFEYDGVWSKSLPDVNSQNHTAVHYGGLGLCAIALGNKPEWQTKATERIRVYIAEFIDDTGYGTEGIDYTNYGLLGVVPYAVALQRSTGVDLIAEQPSMNLIPNQLIWTMLPWGNEVIAMNDNPTTLGSSAGIMYIISRYKLQEALWAWFQIEGEQGAKSYGGGRLSYRGDNRPSIGDGLSLPLVLLWGDSQLEPVAPTKLSHLFSSGRVFMRDSWGNPLGSHVSFTSGTDYHAAHNHSDENAFTFNALGEEFAIDPGRFPWSTRSHNAILVNGSGQIKGYGRGRILDFREMGNAVYVKGDAKEAYAPALQFGYKNIETDSNQLVFSVAQRQLLYVRGKQPYLFIVDDFQTEDNKVNEYTWLLHTDTANTIMTFPKKNAAQIMGSNRGAICDINFLWPQTNLSIEESDLIGAQIIGVGKITDKNRLLSNHYKELNAKTKAKNPHFVTLLLAREDNSIKPTITRKGNAEKVEVRLKFANGVNDIIILTQEDIEFSRTFNK
jgi:hypothetical protein